MADAVQVMMRYPGTASLGVCLSLWLLSHSCGCQAGDLIYRPINPNFGGNPSNGLYLLSNAEAQNDYKDPSIKPRPELEPPSKLDRFIDSLQSRLLSDLITDIRDGTPGILRTEDFELVIQQDEMGTVQVTITDLVTNEVTEIEVGGLAPVPEN